MLAACKLGYNVGSLDKEVMGMASFLDGPWFTGKSYICFFDHSCTNHHRFVSNPIAQRKDKTRIGGIFHSYDSLDDSSISSPSC